MSNITPLTQPASAPRGWRSAKTLARAAAWLAVAVFSLLLLVWLALHWVILPNIDRWRPLLETKASQALGIPVRIGSVEARSSDWVPAVELRDVVLLDAQMQPALHLSRVVAAVSLPSLLASFGSFELRLAQLLIEGASLDVRRDQAGRVFVAGLDVSGGASAGSSGGAADWFFRQYEVALHDASLRWTDEQRGAPPLELSAIDFVASNGPGRHSLRLEATPPPAWGERFRLRGEFSRPLLARSSHWQHWSGEVDAEAPHLDVSRVRDYVDLPFALNQGSGALRASLDLRAGMVNTVTFDMALRELRLRLAPQLEPLNVLQVQGRFAIQRSAEGGSVTLRGFEFTTGDGVHWPAGDMEFTWTEDAGGEVSGGTLNAGRLDLAVIAGTVQHLPLGEALRALVAEGAPKGIASEVQASWEGPINALTHYRLSTRLSDLALTARPPETPGARGWPGVRKASVVLSVTEKGGEATLTMKDGAIDLPGVLAEPVLPLDALEGKLAWRIEPNPEAEPTLQVQLVDGHVANADFQADLKGIWKSGSGQDLTADGRLPGILELDATLTQVVAARIARYLPLAVPEATHSYLEHVLLGGTIARASVRFGTAAPGEFRIEAVADDVTLAYVPNMAAAAGEPLWPPLTHLSGDFVVDGTTFEFHDVKARIFALEISGAGRGSIGNPAEKPTLTLDLQARGPLADLLRFVEATPVGDWIDGTLRETTASGVGHLGLALSLPLSDLKETTVKGSVQLSGSDLRIRPDLPLLGAAHGRIDFTSKAMTLSDVSARVFGGEVVLAGGTQADGSLRFTAQGNATAEGLRRAPELGQVARAAAALSGQAAYRLVLALVQGRPQVELTSNLVGMALDLPPPLQKATRSTLPLRVQTTLAAGTGPPSETLRIDLGTTLHAQFQRDANGQVRRGGIGIFEPAPRPASGVAAAISLPRLDVDAWQDALARLFGGGGGGESVATAGFLPSQVSLKTQELIFGGRTLSGVAGELSLVDGQWRIDLAADQAAGRIEYRPPGTGAEAGRIYARLKRLALPESDAHEVTTLTDSQLTSVPALDIVVDDLELRGRHLGRMEIKAVNRLAPVREWQLTRFRIGVPEAGLSATGRWLATTAAANSRRRAEFQFDLDFADSGALLARLGTPDAVRGGRGKLSGQVAWMGSPLAIDYPSMGGHLNLAVEQGQFLQVRPGAARLLGVFSLQSLARRLTFDFRDIFLEGFVFDSIGGDVQIREGVASTSNFLIRGAPATVLLEGSADLARETQDLRVVVMPAIPTGAATLAVAVINPVIGLGSHLANRFLREPLNSATTREFRVTGSWADPQVEAVTH